MTGTAGEAALPRQRPLSNGELSTLCSGLALVLRAGISLAEGLELLAGEARDGQILTHLKTQAEQGMPLSQAMAESRLFPSYVCDMTAVGEASGRLDSVLEALAVHYRREEAVARAVRGAFSYPLVMAGVLLAVVGVLTVTVTPVFEGVFQALGSEAAGPARAVLDLGTLLGRYSALLLVLVALAGLGLVLLWATPAGRNLRARLLEAFPLTRSLSEKIATGRFASAMAIMLQSGLDTERCLELAGRAAAHRQVERRIAVCRKSMEAGESFAVSATEAGLFSGLPARMVTAGSRAGALDSVMRELADRSGEEIDARINSLLSLLEPLLVAVLALVSGGILLAVMLPLLGVMSSLG